MGDDEVRQAEQTKTQKVEKPIKTEVAKAPIKEEQKELAQRIRNGKNGRKPINRNDVNYDDWNSLEYNQDAFRHRHIIYCTMFNNTPYNAIEQPRDENNPRPWYLDKIREEWEGMLNETD